MLGKINPKQIQGMMKQMGIKQEEIEAQRGYIEEQNNTLIKQHQDIISSINYAKRIQTAILPPMEDMKRIHDEEINSVKKAHEEERQRHDKNVKKLEEDLKTSQDKYDQTILELENKKKINVVKIVKKYGKDPAELAKKVQSITGFEIVMPEVKK